MIETTTNTTVTDAHNAYEAAWEAAWASAAEAQNELLREAFRPIRIGHGQPCVTCQLPYDKPSPLPRAIVRGSWWGRMKARLKRRP